ncbi:30S ribosomal protein S13 [Vampirovibrio chlorellavorus]|jgi:small subunit ribosomal protein S13|uniref:30S ribosomal protein S13 n=1 Tax=Vampirovibrio chlorellavorus TaxID=758823 RepID=UPI000AAAF742|nr:30S ribosomal protein S13 [Vampirovibrio chlorellavorus]
MARIVGVDLPRNKKMLYALPYIYGIGLSLARKILQITKIDPDKRTDDLTESEINALRDEIEKNYQVEGDLRRSESLNIKRLIEINCYRGQRHKRGLPTRGQRTKTNARTRRGKRSAPMKKKA